MPAAVPVPIRQAIFRRWEQGATTAELSPCFGVAPRAIRNLLRRWRERGEDGLAPDYRRPPDTAPTPDHPAFGPALLLRRQHPRWGAGLIRVYLAQQGLAPLPGVRTLQRWFRRAGLAPAPPGRRPDAEGRRATSPHEIWEVDAAEEIHLAGGGSACWLRIVDEFTGAVLHTAVSPLGRWNGVPAVATQEQLRAAVLRWGLPRAIRVDNGSPWGSAGDLPTDLAVWLIGLGVEMIWNPPRCPQANGVVERSQGTGKRWAEPETCRDAAELPGRLDEQDEIQRRWYPSIAGRSRWEAFPGLAHSGRAYRRESEAASWDLARVLSYLAGCVAVRRGDGSGTISLYNRNRYVGRALAGRDVYVTLDPTEVEWVYSDQAGVCYRRQKAEELTAERIIGLAVYHRRERVGPGRPKGVARLPAQPHVA